MKTALLTAFIATVFCLNAQAQSCLPTGIIFGTQTEIDNFSINYPGCTIIEGDIEIKGDSITNLDGLGSLTAVGGNLRIDSCKALSNLNGLANLGSVGVLTLIELPQITSLGSLSNLTTLFGLSLFQLPQITNLNGLENITVFGGVLALVRLPQLTNLNGLENITAVEGLIISDLPLVTNLDGLANITSVGVGQFVIATLPQLTSFSSLENLMTIGGDIALSNLPQILSLNILENITAVEGQLFLSQLPQVTNLNSLRHIATIEGDLVLNLLPQITSLSGLDSLKSVGNDIIILANGSLKDLQGLEQLDSLGGQFTVSYNPVLTNCVVEILCNQVDISLDSVFIQNNSAGCNSPAEVKAECNLQPGLCLVNGIDFDSQAEVDQFSINYPGCKVILGDVVINGSDITNLDSLIVLTALGKKLDIGSTNLPDLVGLDSLRSVGSSIFIQFNGVLKGLQGLDHLDSLGGRVTIAFNPVLTNCVVESLCDQLDIALDSVLIQNNSNGCNSPAEVKAACELPPGQCLPGGINFYSQAQVDQFAINYPGCKEIVGDVLIQGSDITSLDSLSALTALGKGLVIAFTHLPDLSGLENLSSIGGVFTIIEDSSITHLNALENVTHIGGGLHLDNLPMLTSLSGLENSAFSSGSSLTIANNFALTSLDNIGVFTSVTDCIINNNAALNDLSGLETIDSIFGLYIATNASLHDLTALSNTYIRTTCDIGANAVLTSLTGLENMLDLDNLRITSNPVLTNLNPLSNLKRVVNCEISANDALPDLSGLENLDSISSLFISQNALLLNLTALGNVKVAKYCTIQNNLTLESLAGLEQLDSLIVLYIEYNPLLVNLSGLNNVTHVGNCSVGGNTALLSLSGLENLKTTGSLGIFSNPELINLEGVNNLRATDQMTIYDNTKLSGLAQFNSLDSMTQLNISGNPALTNLNGLDSLKSILYGWDSLGLNSNLQIENNAALTNIQGLQNLTAIKRIQINGNQSLSDCAIDAVCSRLATEPDLVFVENNAPGCSTPFEIETQCGGTIVSISVLIDSDGDCQPQGDPAPHLMVHFSNPVQSVFRETDLGGITRFVLLSMDTFSLELPQILADQWDICEQRYLLQSAAGNDSISAFLLLKPLNQCPELTANLALPSNFRSCLTTSDVQVSVRNSGTVLAEAVRAAVVMPPVLELLASNPLASGQNGDTLFFELGDLHAFETGTVQLTVKTKCDTFLLGQTLCIETFATLDNPCPTTLPAFSEIKLSATCLGDTLVRFTIKNIGDAPTQGQHSYTIIRNETVVQTENFSLANQQSMTVDLPSDGATYRMEATKFDDGTLTATALENCGGLTPGFITAFWLDEGPLEYDFDCRQVIGAYDPNQKTAVPSGSGPYNTIIANQPIQYTIDFQNTGTDTAYRVLLRDVLPSDLDLETFRPGFSSHPCFWEIRGNTLEVLFSPIALPDSNVNEPASHGFFSFNIGQKPNLPDGTYFQNTASIIFDFNPPIITNTVYHNIGKLTVDIDEPQRYADLWQVAGNPTRDAATFSALTFIAGEKRFELYNAAGRPVRTVLFSGQSFVFQRDILPGGMYFFRIGDERGRWFTGKIVVIE